MSGFVVTVLGDGKRIYDVKRSSFLDSATKKKKKKKKKKRKNSKKWNFLVVLYGINDRNICFYMVSVLQILCNLPFTFTLESESKSRGSISK